MDKKDILKNLNESQKQAVINYQGPCFIVAGPGSGKCIEGESIIFTDKGIVEIQNIPLYYKVNSNNECESTIRSLDLENKTIFNTSTSHFYNMGESETIKISTSYGYSIEGTPEHPIIVLNQEGDIEFKKLHEITKDDYVAISLNNNIWSNENIIEPDFSYLMGLLVGDGCLCLKGGTIGFSNSNINISTSYKELVHTYLSIDSVKPFYKKDSKTTDWMFHNIYAKAKLESFGLKMVKSGEKDIPESVLMSTKESIISFLQGLFDTDGSFNPKKGVFEYCTKSKKLAKQVHMLLLNFGIVSKLKPRKVDGYKSDYYYIYVSGSMLRTLRDLIGFRNEENKLNSLSKYCNEKLVNDNKYTIPHQSERFRRIRTKLNGKDYYCGKTSRIMFPEPIGLKRVVSGVNSPSINFIKRVLSSLDFKNEDTEYLRFLSENFMFDNIVSIEKGSKVVYDFTVPGTHSFVSNGIISHNTLTLISRTAYMLKEGISSKNILLFTFTKKAANEIKIRVNSMVTSSQAKDLSISTYHSFGAKVLRDNYKCLDYDSNFTICDENDKEKIISKLAKEYTSVTEKDLAAYISYCKSNMITAKEAITKEPGNYSELYQKYENNLKRNNTFDFDDLIFKTIILLKNNKDVLEKVNAKYKYIIADESHDSSITDLELIKLLAGKNQNICMILDDEQSIYSFRYANVHSVIAMREYFNDCKEYILNKNYRSTDTIVKSSRSLISKNVDQIKKEISTDNEKGEKIVLFESKDPYREANKIVQVIMFLTRKYSLDYKDIAILYRMNSLSIPIENKLLENHIPYKMVSSRAFYARKEIKDINSYLRFAYNPKDVESFCRIINVPKRGVGDVTLNKILEESSSKGLSIEEVCGKIKANKKTKTNLLEFISLIHEIRSRIEDMEDIDETIEFIIKDINYKEYLKSNTKVINKLGSADEDEDGFKNIDQLIALSREYDNPIDFIQNVSLLGDIVEEEVQDNKVQLMTMHASKGLEFPAVIMVGLNEGCVPFYKAYSQEEISEERRLFYVGMTRAMKHLFLSTTEYSILFGKFVPADPSRFIGNIDPKYIEEK